MLDIKWKYEKRGIDELTNNEDNPRRLSKKRAEDLKKSLEKFGMCQPVVIQLDGSVVGGHQRLKTLRALGHNEVAVAIPSRKLSDREANELTIGLNKISGEFDLDMLANRWDVDILLDAGFTSEELHMDVEPNEKPKQLSINIKFENEDDLKFIEGQLNTVLCDFPTATMKVRCK